MGAFQLWGKKGIGVFRFCWHIIRGDSLIPQVGKYLILYRYFPN